jgi:hypothetical protein
LSDSRIWNNLYIFFYFRARGDAWSFAISEHTQIEPIDIQLPEQGQKYGYLEEGKYGKEWEDLASWMELSEAERMIIECCREYRKMKNIG